MGAEKLIQVNFQLPVSALNSLSRLAEQLRLLTEAAGRQQETGGSATMEGEHGESGSFDPERFLALRQSADMPPRAAEAAASDIGGKVPAAPAVSADVREELQDPEAARNALPHRPEGALEEDTLYSPQHILEDEQDIPSTLPEVIKPEQAGAIPTVRAEAEKTVPGAPEAARDVAQQVPDVESARAEAEERELALAAVRGEVSGGIETPLGAGAVVQADPETPRNRWTNVTEELVIPGPAPLTAEAVSLAFERDGRRYDNGFPLY